MSLNQFWCAIEAQRAWLIVIALIVGGLGCASTLRMTKTMTAEAQLVLDFRPDPMLAGFASAIGMATQIEVLKSDKVSLRAAQILLADGAPRTVAALQKVQTNKPWSERTLANTLETGLTVDAVRGSNVIAIVVSATDGEFAQIAANAYAKAAIDVSLQLRSEPTREAADWLTGESKALRIKLEESQARLSNYQASKGIVGNEERVNQELTRLNTLEAALAQAETQVFDVASRSSQGGTVVAVAEPGQAATVISLRGQLTTLQGRLEEARGNLGSGHPKLQQLEAQTEELKRQLEIETRRQVASDTARVQAVASAVARANSQKVAELRRLLDAQKAVVLSMRSQRDEITRMARDVDAAQRAYDSANLRAGQLALESQNTQAGVRLLSAAADWTDKSHRRMLLRALISVVVGLALGVVAAVVVERRDRRVRTLDDLIVDPDLQVIGLLRQATTRGRHNGSTPRIGIGARLALAGARERLP
jgi:polysaccharide biosynthesis transport protein